MNKSASKQQAINARRRHTNSLTKPVTVFFGTRYIYNRASVKCREVARILGMTPEEIIPDFQDFLESKMIGSAADIKMMSLFFGGPLSEFENRVGKITLRENGEVIYEMLDSDEDVCFRLKRSKSDKSLLISYRTYSEDEINGGYEYSPYHAIPIHQGYKGVYNYLNFLGERYNKGFH